MRRPSPTRSSSQTASKASARCAFSLIEMLTVMSVAALLFGIVVSMMHHLLQWDRDVCAWSASSGEVSRLVDVLRDDIRRATEVTNPAEDMIVVVLPDDHRIEYRLEGRFCYRNTFIEDKNAQGEQLFSIGLPGSWQVDRNDADRGPLTTVRLNRLPQRATDPAPPTVAVCIAVGADRWPDSMPNVASNRAHSEPSDESSVETSNGTTSEPSNEAPDETSAEPPAENNES